MNTEADRTLDKGGQLRACYSVMTSTGREKVARTVTSGSSRGSSSEQVKTVCKCLEQDRRQKTERIEVGVKSGKILDNRLGSHYNTGPVFIVTSITN